MDLSRKAIAPNGDQLLLERACNSISKGNIYDFPGRVLKPSLPPPTALYMPWEL